MLLFAVCLLLLTLAEAHTELLHQLLLWCHLSPQGTWAQPLHSGLGDQSFRRLAQDNREEEAGFSLGGILGERFALVFF